MVSVKTNICTGVMTCGMCMVPATEPSSVTAASGTTLAVDTEVVVYYTVTQSGLSKFEIFGATNSTIEGSAQFQNRALDGGIIQIWDLASVSLSPNGNLTYPMDAHQTVPLTMTLQERAGTFGYIYVG